MADLHLESIYHILDTSGVDHIQITKSKLSFISLSLFQTIGEYQLVDLFSDLEQNTFTEESIDLGQSHVIYSDLEESLG